VKRDVFGRLPTGYGKSLTVEFNLPTVNVAGVEFLKVPIMSKFLFFHPIFHVMNFCKKIFYLEKT